MVQIAGKYQLVSSINTEEIVRIMGEEITEDAVDELNSLDCVLTIDVDEDKYIFAHRTKYWERSIWFVVGKRFLEGDGTAITEVEKVGDNFVFNCWSNGNLLRRSYQFFDGGVTMTLDCGNGKLATRLFRRL